MSTKAQIKANRQNAQESTGPRTAQGKAAVSQSAVKHRLFGSQAVVKGENEADFDLFTDKMLAEPTPVGALESMLASTEESRFEKTKPICPGPRGRKLLCAQGL
ncbi:MAG: hypothetical protein PVJ86_06950 [Phycisphaerales bacterium]|jgi:hypothetical protein